MADKKQQEMLMAGGIIGLLLYGIWHIFFKKPAAPKVAAPATPPATTGNTTTGTGTIVVTPVGDSPNPTGNTGGNANTGTGGGTSGGTVDDGLIYTPPAMVDTNPNASNAVVSVQDGVFSIIQQP